MFAPMENEIGLERNHGSCEVTRRRLLGVGLSGTVAALGMAVSPCFAGTSSRNLDFGPQYSVHNVYQIGEHTHVELGFRVNGRPFRMHLRSTDGRIWRTV